MGHYHEQNHPKQPHPEQPHPEQPHPEQPHPEQPHHEDPLQYQTSYENKVNGGYTYDLLRRVSR